MALLQKTTFDLSLKELRSFLDRECPDPHLRAEVERRVLDRSTSTGLPTHRAPVAHVKATLSSGEVIVDRYRINKLIGRGGMGEVYEARDLLLREDVALKTLRADLAGDEDVLQRFQKEIALARKVTHPNVCRIFEVGIHRSTGQPPVLFFVMELLKGHTLAERIDASRLTRDEAFPIAAQLADGLHAAHKAGIVHADFKSANVILVPTRGGVRAVITDFGVARLDPASASVEETYRPIDTARVAGTLAYMSPEQLAGDRVTTASDIYSFGIVLFEMACGQRPFDDADLIKAAMLRAGGPAVSVRTKIPYIDDRWENAIARCLQRDPDRRFRSAGEIAKWFREGSWWNVPYWTRHDMIRAALAVTFVVFAVISAWKWSYRPYQPLPAALVSYQRGVSALHSMTYETARKALEQTVAIDPSFALAHASLARAYDELDYTDRAKDSMLRAITAAQESRLTPEDDRRLRALQFMVSRDYERASPLLQQIEAEARDSGRAVAALESGWLAQQMENSNGAATAFERSLKASSHYAPALLRLGFMYGRRGGPNDLALALQTFTDAERRYTDAGDYEGVTQTLLERANLLVRRSRQKEALPTIEKALGVARTVGNRYQEVRLMLLQGTALRDLDETSRAADLVRKAIDIAAAENMDNLTTTGQIDLGNIYLRIDDRRTAEPIFQRALDMAGRSHVRRTEARARIMLGSLYEQDHRPELAAPLVRAGLSFYGQAGYRREYVQAGTLLGGLLRQIGNNDESIRVLREALPGAVHLQDRRLEAQLHERIGDTLRDQGNLPDALMEYQQAGTLNPSALSAELLRVMTASLQWRLGLRDEAERSLNKAAQFVDKNRDSRLSSSIGLMRAEIAYANGRLDEAYSLIGPPSSPAKDEAFERQVMLLRSRVLIRKARVAAGMASASAVIGEFEQARLPGDAAAARLAVAEALVLAGERESAAMMAQAALAYFDERHVWESVWRAHAVVARASRDRAAIEEQDNAAAAAFAQMKNMWPAPSIERYRQRPDITSLEAGTR